MEEKVLEPLVPTNPPVDQGTQTSPPEGTSPFNNMPNFSNIPASEPLPVGNNTTEVPPNPVVLEEQTPEPVLQPMGGGGGKKILLSILFLLILGIAIVAILKFVLPGVGISKTTLTYWGLWENDQIISPIIADFEKTHPNIKINYVKQSPKEYRERLASSLARGEGPDIFRFHNTWLPMFSRDLSPLPTTVVSSLNLEQNLYPVAKTDLKRGNNFYGVPLEIDGLGLFVNTDIFQAAGATYPTTWEELRSTATKLTVKDEEGKIRTAGIALGVTSNVEHWSDILGLMMLQNGADLSNPTGNLAQDALTYFKLFATPPNNTWDNTLDNSILAFAKGNVAMILAPSWEAFEIKNINQSTNFKIMPVPQLPGSNITWASYWAEGVWQNSKNKDAAFTFLSYLASKDVMTKLFAEESKIRLFGEPYSRVDLAPTLLNDSYAGAYVSQAQTAKSFYMCSRTFDNGINDKVIKYYEDAVNSLDSGVSAPDALATAAKGIQQVLTTYGVAISGQ